MNADTFMKAMPGLSRQLATAYLPSFDAAMREFGITTPARAHHWLSQVGHESNSLQWLQELASGSAYEGRKDLGNTVKGDGVRFKGRGPIQVTGRYNYTAAGKALGLDLTGNPGQAAKPPVAFRISAWWWRNAGLNTIADNNPNFAGVTPVTRKVNGGTRGLADRQRRFRIVQALGAAVLPGPGGTSAPPPAAAIPPGNAPALRVPWFGRGRNDRCPDVQVWQERMLARGWNLGPAGADGVFGPQSERVARQFQQEKGLTQDGKVGPETWRAAWELPA